MGGRLVSDRLGAADSTPHGLSNTHETRCPCWGAVPGPVGNPGRPRWRPAPDVAAGTPIRAAAAAADDGPRQPRRRVTRRNRVPAPPPPPPSADTTVTTDGVGPTAGQERPGCRGRLCRHPADDRDRPAARGQRPGPARGRTLFPDPGQRLLDRVRDVPVLHQEPRQPSLAERLGALHARRREGSRRGLQAPLGHQLPRRPRGRGARHAVPERRRRQVRPVPARGAAARQDRRVRRQREDRGDQGRREAARDQQRDPPRLVHRPGPDPPRRERRPRDAVREGLPGRRGLAHRHADCRRPQAREPHVHDQGRPPRPHQGHRLHRQRGDGRWGAEAPDEGEQGADAHQPLPQQGRLPAGQVRGGRRERPRALSRRGLHRRSRRAARDQDARGLRRRQEPVGAAAHSRHRRPPLQGRQVRLRGQHGRQGRGPAADLQARDRRLLLREEDPQGPREGA